jgi:hypothetical protein
MGVAGEGIITPATKYLKFRHSGESRNLLKRLDAGSRDCVVILFFVISSAARNLND